MKRTLAVVLAGGEGERLSILSSVRAKPAVPFGGKYRIIDFTLSNCVNSGIDNVVILTQYNPRSLNDHIGLGRPWDLDRNTGGVRLLQPYIARGRIAEWYRGTADAVLQNLADIEHQPDDTVLILAGDHIYKMDYQPFVAFHRRHRADVTIAVRRVPLADAIAHGHPRDGRRRAASWSGRRSRRQPKSDLASMGVYVFSKRALRRWLDESRVDFGANVIPAMIDGGARVFGYRFDGYWQDVGTIQSYWETNMALLDDAPDLDLYDRDWLIHTRSEERAPAHDRRDRAGPSIAHLARLRDQRDGRQFRAVAGRSRRRRRGRARFDRDVRHRHPHGRRGGPRDHRQGGADRARAAVVGDGSGPDAPERAGAGPAEHRHHGGRQARGDPARDADRPQRARRSGRARIRLPGPPDPVRARRSNGASTAAVG